MKKPIIKPDSEIDLTDLKEHCQFIVDQIDQYPEDLDHIMGEYMQQTGSYLMTILFGEEFDEWFDKVYEENM